MTWPFRIASAVGLLTLACGGDDATTSAGSAGSAGGAGTALNGGSAGDSHAAGGDGSGGAATGAHVYDAADHVQGDFTGLLVEVDYVAGNEPAPDALERLQTRIESLAASGHIAKPEGVRMVVDQEVDPFGVDTVHTGESLRELEPSLRTVATNPGESSIHVFYVDGHYEGDDPPTAVLGFASPGSWIVMFKDNIERACDDSSALALPLLAPLAGDVCAVAEANTLIHEIGHVFGLVDNGTPMAADHEDPAHEGHDRNEDCIMFWLVESSDAVDVVAERFQLGNREIASFDDACLADLEAFASR